MANKTTVCLEHIRLELLDHATHTPYLTLKDFDIFLSTERVTIRNVFLFRCRNCRSGVEQAVHKTESFFQEGIQKLIKVWSKWIDFSYESENENDYFKMSLYFLT